MAHDPTQRQLTLKLEHYQTLTAIPTASIAPPMPATAVQLGQLEAMAETNGITSNRFAMTLLAREHPLHRPDHSHDRLARQRIVDVLVLAPRRYEVVAPKPGQVMRERRLADVDKAV